MQTIGERLEEARKKKGISIREAADATKIRGDYLQKIEGNQFDIALSEIYVRGFLRNYASFLKLPTDRIINDYTALGRGETRASRPPVREGYGRTGIAPTAAEPGEPVAAPAEVGADPATGRPAPRKRSSAPALPSGPDPALIFRAVKIGGVVLVGLVLLWIIKSLFWGGSAPASPTTNKSAIVTRGPAFGLVALKPVQVTVRKKTPTGGEGEILFSGIVAPGDTKIVPRPGAVFIEASAPENLLLEINGARFPMGLRAGEHRGELPAPPTS